MRLLIKKYPYDAYGACTCTNLTYPYYYNGKNLFIFMEKKLYFYLGGCINQTFY